jgi:peptide-methionine (S)-S-oxide reductase
MLMRRSNVLICRDPLELPCRQLRERLRQQYLAKNPNGYRCHSATGVAMPWPVEGVETKLG